MGRRRRRTARATAPHRRPLRIEPLEDRRLLAVATVTTLTDTIDFNDGVTSLREAIFAANTMADADAIEFDPALTAGGPATILLTLGQLSITGAVTIDGPGAKLLSIDAKGNDPTPNENNGDGSRVFYIGDSEFTSFFDVELVGLTLTGGDVIAGGGAISSAENLRLTGLIVTDNFAKTEGGGINQSAGILTIIDSVISHNASLNLGGGIFSFSGSIVVSSSVVSFNSTQGSLAAGGGISVSHSLVAANSGNSVLIEDSVIANNTTIGSIAEGGGLYVRGGTGPVGLVSVAISRSTISGNTSRSSGGGIYLDLATVTISDSTISENRVLPGGFGFGGGGMHVGSAEAAVIRSTITANFSARSLGGVSWEGLGELTFDHSIVAGNTTSDILAMPFDVGGVTALYSLIGAGAEIVDAGGNIIGMAQSPIDPLLGSLAYNGGPVFLDGSRMLTHALLAGSPAIDAGDPAAVAGVGGVPEFDQRGMPWSRVVDGRIDKGAFESQVNRLPGRLQLQWRGGWGGLHGVARYAGIDGRPASGWVGATPGVPDGVVDEHDYDFWKANFGEHVAGGEWSGRRWRWSSSGRPGSRERCGVGDNEVAAVRRHDHVGKTPGKAGAARRESVVIQRRDDALLAWLARRGGVDAIENHDGSDAPSPDAASDSAVDVLDDVFVGLDLEL